jgi:hypothetical protein
VDAAGAGEKFGVVVNDVRRAPKEVSKVSRGVRTSLSIFLTGQVLNHRLRDLPDLLEVQCGKGQQEL